MGLSAGRRKPVKGAVAGGSWIGKEWSEIMKDAMVAMLLTERRSWFAKGNG